VTCCYNFWALLLSVLEFRALPIAYVTGYFSREGESLGFSVYVRQEVTWQADIYPAYCSRWDSLLKPTETRNSPEELAVNSNIAVFGITRCCELFNVTSTPSEVFLNSHRPENPKCMETMTGNDSLPWGWSQIQISAGEKIFLSSETPRPALGPTFPALQWILGFFCGVKLTTYLSSSAVVKNEWSYMSIPPIRLHGADRDIFSFACGVATLCNSHKFESLWIGKFRDSLKVLISIVNDSWPGTDGSSWEMRPTSAHACV